MKLLLTGDNNFEIEQKLNEIIGSYEYHINNIDGSNTEINLNYALLGQDLFSTNRLVVIRNISEDSINFETLVNLISKVGEEITLVIVDQNLDKRTKLYKDLIKNVEVITYNLWSEDDVRPAVVWTKKLLLNRNIVLKDDLIEEIVIRAGMNQWDILHAIEKIELSDIENLNINDILEPVESENVFKLLETALSKDKIKLNKSIENLMVGEDPFRLLALIISQFLIVAAIVNSNSVDNVAKDLGASPYMVSKLVNIAKTISPNKCKKILNILSDSDEQIKSSNNDPWVILNQALIKTASI